MDSIKHPTTTSARLYVRIIGFILLSFLFISFIPYVSREPEFQVFFSNQLVNMAILFAIIVGFFISITLEKRQALDEYITLELNKIRRIYHLALHLQLKQPQLRPWFEELCAAIRDYQKLFSQIDFGKYDQGNVLFRRVTYTIYKLPSLNLQYNNELFFELLDATADATESRQHIRTKLATNLGRFQWIVLIIVTLILSSLLVASTPPDILARLVAAAVLLNLFLVLDLLNEYDRPTLKKFRAMASRYAENLPEVMKRAA